MPHSNKSSRARDSWKHTALPVSPFMPQHSPPADRSHTPISPLSFPTKAKTRSVAGSGHVRGTAHTTKQADKGRSKQTWGEASRHGEQRGRFTQVDPAQPPTPHVQPATHSSTSSTRSTSSTSSNRQHKQHTQHKQQQTAHAAQAATDSTRSTSSTSSTSSNRQHTQHKQHKQQQTTHAATDSTRSTSSTISTGRRHAPTALVRS